MLKNNLVNDQIQALKSARTEELETLRYILSQIKNREIEKRSDLTDEETIEVLKKIAKELKESIDSFEKGARRDLLNKSKKQLEITFKYLPPEISEDELKSEVQKIIDANRELYQANPKAIIGLCMKELKNKADPQRIMSMLNSL